MANSDINEELGLEKIEEGSESQLYHVTDPSLLNPEDTQLSDINLQGIEGLVNAVYDPNSDPGKQVDDTDINISLINGMLYINYTQPDPPGPSDKSRWIKYVLNCIKSINYRVFYSKSSDNRTLPFDNCRGFIIWDFDNEILHFISPNKNQELINMKYPITIDTIGFEDVYCIEAYYNLSDNDKV